MEGRRTELLTLARDSGVDPTDLTRLEAIEDLDDLRAAVLHLLGR